MPDLPGEASLSGEPVPVPQLEPGPASDSAQHPESPRGVDTLTGTAESPALDAQEEDDAILGAEDLAENIRAVRPALGGTRLRVM